MFGPHPKPFVRQKICAATIRCNAENHEQNRIAISPFVIRTVAKAGGDDGGANGVAGGRRATWAR
jgi:hypothetical protein